MKLNGKKDEKATHGVTLPRDVLELWKWRKGDKLNLIPNNEDESITITKKTK